MTAVSADKLGSFKSKYKIYVNYYNKCIKNNKIHVFVIKLCMFTFCVNPCPVIDIRQSTIATNKSIKQGC